jgi:hypothetical protein
VEVQPQFAKPYVKASLPAVVGQELHQASDVKLTELIQIVAAVEGKRPAIPS